MTIIRNVAKNMNPVLKIARGTLEHRAQWLYFLLKEAEKKGVSWEEIGYPAIRSCGSLHGRELVASSGTNSLIGLRKKLFTLPARLVFDMKIIESTDKKLYIDFGYCPLVAAWQKLGINDINIARLCDIAMEGDRGIAEGFGARLELGGTISKGHPVCQIKFIKD